jgi:hypothetical protein
VKENLDGDNSEPSATEERIIPPKVIEIIEETDELENWPHFPSRFLNTACFWTKKINKLIASDEFEILPEEVRRRASWAWYRSSLLCMRASQIVASACVDVSDRNIEHHEER